LCSFSACSFALLAFICFRSNSSSVTRCFSASWRFSCYNHQHLLSHVYHDYCHPQHHTIRFTCIYSVYHVLQIKNKYASYLNWRISPHADRHNSRHWPVCHTWLATLQPICHTWLTTFQCIVDFSILASEGANPSVKVHRTWRRPAVGASLPSCKISARSRRRSTRCALLKFFTFWPWEANP